MITITVDTTKVQEDNQFETGLSISNSISTHRANVVRENPEMSEREQAEETCRRVNKELTEAKIDAQVSVSDADVPFDISQILGMIAQRLTRDPTDKLREDFKAGLGVTVKHTTDGFTALGADAFMPVTMMASGFIHTIAEAVNIMIPMMEANDDRARQLLFRMATLFMVNHYVNPPHDCRVVDMNVRRDEFLADLRAAMDGKGDEQIGRITEEYAKVRNKQTTTPLH